MKNKDIDNWIVLEGRLVYTARTRKQVRAFAKKHRVKYPQFNYIGKCIKDYHQIILDV